MGNQWGLRLHFIFVSIYFIATMNTCLGAGNVTVACFEHERLALLRFKHSVKDDNGMLSSWIGTECCTWERVICDGVTKNVVSLHLRVAPLDEDDYWLVSNSVSTSLAELIHLKHLDLSGNDFQGSRIPVFIGSLKQLAYLNLSSANFSGIISRHIGNLSNLKILDLNTNSNSELMLHDMAWISGLSSLERLDLSYVQLSGAKNLDLVFYSIPSLKELRLSNCGLSNVDLGPLRSNLSTARSTIKRLDLSYNHFKGQLPRVFENMTFLQFLDLSLFEFSSTWNFANLLRMIPSLTEIRLLSCNLNERHLYHVHHNFTTLSNIQHLDLSENSFYSGRFPSILANMTSLRVLRLSYSHLNSSIPVMPNLLELDISGNRFEHVEDVGIWRQCYLKKLIVSSNKFLMELTDSPTNISECSQYALETLDLASSLNGTIPESLIRLTNLRGLFMSGELTGLVPKWLESVRLLQVLDLSSNMLTGPIPTFPQKLTKLYLNGNYLNGSIPESLGRLRLLQVLDLSRNVLTGPIPTFHGKLTNLDLSNNQLNGSIPESFERLTALTELFLQNNQLTGPIPSSIGKLVSLELLYINSNFLSGTIPVSIGQLTKLYRLDVSNNSLEGTVFEAHFANLSMLKYVFAASNSKLTFNVSHEWLPPFQLITIDLSSCKIANGFPQWLRNQGKLDSLVLSNATISGPLPAWLQNMPNIRLINLSHNKFTGPLPSLPTGVTYVNMQNNFFNESIPTSLCKMTDLVYLYLSRNRLTGEIPKCFKNLEKLMVMVLSSNGLSGVIPSSLGHISSLTWLNLNDNKLRGELPLELWNLTALTVLDLGNNAFYGKIPEWIGENVAGMAVFRLHKNNFTGRIPQSLCTIASLQILDVSHNNLSGTIPRCLGDLQGMRKKLLNLRRTFNDNIEEGVIQVMKGIDLEYTNTLQLVINMDLSSNKLVGEIPVELTALSGLLGLNLSNNHLRGRIPNNIGNMKALNSLDLSENWLTGVIPSSIAALNFLSHLNLSNNNLSGRIPRGNQLQTLIDPSIYVGNKDLCGDPLLKNCSNHDDPTTTVKNKYEATNETDVWLYVNIMCGFATGFCGVILVLLLKNTWRHKFFLFAEETMDNIQIVVMVRVNKMKRGRQAI